MRVQDLVEEALVRATGPLVVVLRERSEANLRWAGNALTTNGEMRSLTLTVTATAADSSCATVRGPMIGPVTPG